MGRKEGGREMQKQKLHNGPTDKCRADGARAAEPSMVLVSSVTQVKTGCWERVKVTTPATESREEEKPGAGKG